MTLTDAVFTSKVDAAVVGPATTIPGSKAKRSHKGKLATKTTKEAAEGCHRAAAAGKIANPPKKLAKSPDTKAVIVLKKLNSPKGATIEILMEATNWQAHSIRGFLSAVVRKKLGMNLVSDIGKDGVRRYRIDEAAITSK